MLLANRPCEREKLGIGAYYELTEAGKHDQRPKPSRNLIISVVWEWDGLYLY